MKNSFGEIYLTLTKKERVAVLFAVKTFDSRYANLHMGQISFLNLNIIRQSMGECLAVSKNLEEAKSRAPVSSKICQSILEKLLTNFQSRSITLDSLKVKSKASRFNGEELYVTYFPIFEGRISCRVELKPHKKNVFVVTTKNTHLNEALQQLTYKFGLYNNQ